MWQSSPPGFFYSVALCPRHRFPIKSFALLACVSPCKIHLRVLDKSPHSGPRRSPSSAMNPEIFFIPLSSLKSNTSFFFWWLVNGFQSLLFLLLIALSMWDCLPSYSLSCLWEGTLCVLFICIHHILHGYLWWPLKGDIFPVEENRGYTKK